MYILVDWNTTNAAATNINRRPVTRSMSPKKRYFASVVSNNEMNK